MALALATMTAMSARADESIGAPAETPAAPPARSARRLPDVGTLTTDEIDDYLAGLRAEYIELDDAAAHTAYQLELAEKCERQEAHARQERSAPTGMIPYVAPECDEERPSPSELEARQHELEQERDEVMGLSRSEPGRLLEKNDPKLERTGTIVGFTGLGFVGAGALALLVAGGPYLLVDCGCPPDPQWAVPTAIAGGISVGVGAIIGFTGLGLEIAGGKMVPRLDRQDAGKAQAGMPHVSIGATSVRVRWSF